MFFPNQRQVIIKREKVTDVRGNGRAYLNAYVDNIFQAAQDLSGTAFKVYIYLLANKNFYKLEYSPSHIHKILGISIESGRKALNELIEKKYILENESYPHQFTFLETPTLIQDDNGEYIEILNLMNELKYADKKNKKEIINQLKQLNQKIENLE